MSAPTCPPGEYTAPEVWSNLQSGRSPITTAAADVWALGALGFEIMTGERVLTSPHGAKRVCAEGLMDRAEDAATAGRLGVLRDVILDCLSQQPSQRPTARAIVPVCITLLVVSQYLALVCLHLVECYRTCQAVCRTQSGLKFMHGWSLCQRICQRLQACDVKPSSCRYFKQRLQVKRPRPNVR